MIAEKDLSLMPLRDRAEMAILGNLLLYTGPQTIEYCDHYHLPPAAFSDPDRRRVYAAVRYLAKSGKPFDEESVARHFEAIGGIGSNTLDFIASLTMVAAVSNAGNVTTIQNLLADHRRDVANQAVAHAAEALKGGADPAETLQALQEAAATVLDASVNGHGFTVRTVADAEAYIPPPDLDLWGAGYLSLGQITSLIGHGGLGKTRLAISLACAQITSSPFCGIPTHGQPQRWLFIGQENSMRRWKNDLAMILPHYTPEKQDLIRQHLFFTIPETLNDRFFDPTDPEVAARYKALFKKINPGVVVIDPFNDLLKDGDENSPVIQKSAIEGIRRLVPLNAAILIIHHSKPGAENMVASSSRFSGAGAGRGSKTLYNAVRCEIDLYPGHQTDNAKLVLFCAKANDLLKFEPTGLIFNSDSFQFEIDPDFKFDDWRANANGERSKRSCTIKDICLAFSAPVMSTGDIVDSVIKDVGCVRATVAARIKEALDQEYISCPNRGLYSLADKGRNLIK